MANKKAFLEEENILSFMREPNFESAETHQQDPIVKTKITVTLDQLKPYDNNPRTTRNPKFDSIMESIENRGLDHTPNISRRPGESHYIILDGGNTRLEILNELYLKYQRLAENAQTDEERFQFNDRAGRYFKLDCIFKPWKGESMALAGHMSENEERGETKFIEKAIAVKKFREIYREEDRKKAADEGQEFEDKSLSIRALAERITKQGWTLSHSYITRFDYAVEMLLPVIPRCLWAGAGNPQIITARKYDSSYKRFWASTVIGKSNPEKVSELFFKTLKEFDDEDGIDFKGFMQELNHRLADELNMQHGMIMTEIEAILRGVRDDTDLSSGDETGYESQNNQPVPLSPALLRASLETASRDTGATSNNDTSASSPVTKSISPRREALLQASSQEASIPSTPMTPAELRKTIIENLTEIKKEYPVICFGPADNFMALAILPPWANKDAKGIAFKRGLDDAAAAIWWFLFRRTQTHVGLPPEGVIPRIYEWFGEYLESQDIGEPVGLFLYLETAFINLQYKTKKQLVVVETLIDQLYDALNQNDESSNK